MTLEERLKYFVDQYELVSAGIYGSGPKKIIGDRERKKCRFCGRLSNETTYSNEAHAIPEFLGNHQLILANECDICNKHVSEYLEDHLDKYTKPFRTIAQIKGKRKVPTILSFDKKSRLEKNQEGLKIQAQEDSDFIVHDDENNKFTMHVDLEPYIPAAVYKALVKIGISSIENENELGAFEITNKWILDPDHSKHIMTPLKVWTTFIPGPRPNVDVTLFVFRKKPGFKICHSLMILGFGNFIFQLVIPSHLDEKECDVKEVSYPFFPSPFEKDWDYGALKYSLEDLTSAEIVRKKAPITMQYDQKIEIKTVG